MRGAVTGRPLALPPAELFEFAQRYRRDRTRWATAPRASEMRARLDKFTKAVTAAGSALGDLLPIDLELASMDRSEAGAALDCCCGLAGRALAALADLDARGAGKGGARRVTALLRPPPRFELARDVADRLDRAGVPLGSAQRGPLHDAVLAVLHLADEDGRGLVEVLRQVLKARRANRPEPTPVHPSRDLVA